jgi:sugar phosphate permease
VIQGLTPDDMRGRVMSVWSMIAAGLMPLGSLLLGGLASATGHVTYVIVGGAGVAIVAALVIGITGRDRAPGLVRQGRSGAEFHAAYPPADLEPHHRPHGTV